MQDDIKFPEGEDPAEAREPDHSEPGEVSEGSARPKIDGQEPPDSPDPD